MTTQPDYGIYGPICKRCGTRLSTHSVSLDEQSPDLQPAEFDVPFTGVYCPPLERWP